MRCFNYETKKYNDIKQRMKENTDQMHKQCWICYKCLMIFIKPRRSVELKTQNKNQTLELNGKEWNGLISQRTGTFQLKSSIPCYQIFSVTFLCHGKRNSMDFVGSEDSQKLNFHVAPFYDISFTMNIAFIVFYIFILLKTKHSKYK